MPFQRGFSAQSFSSWASCWSRGRRVQEVMVFTPELLPITKAEKAAAGMNSKSSRRLGDHLLSYTRRKSFAANTRTCGRNFSMRKPVSCIEKFCRNATFDVFTLQNEFHDA